MVVGALAEILFPRCMAERIGKRDSCPQSRPGASQQFRCEKYVRGLLSFREDRDLHARLRVNCRLSMPDPSWPGSHRRGSGCEALALSSAQKRVKTNQK